MQSSPVSLTSPLFIHKLTNLEALKKLNSKINICENNNDESRKIREDQNKEELCKNINTICKPQCIDQEEIKQNQYQKT